MVKIGRELEPVQLAQKVPALTIVRKIAPSVLAVAAGTWALCAVRGHQETLNGWLDVIQWASVSLIAVGLLSTIVIAALVASTVQRPRVGRWVRADAKTAKKTVPYRMLQRLRLLTLSAIGATVAVFFSLLVMASQGKTQTAVVLAVILAFLTTSIIVMRVRQTRPEPLGPDSVAVDCKKLARAGRCVTLAWAPSDKNLPDFDPLLGYEAKTIMWSKMDEDREPGTRRYQLWCIRSAGFAWRLLDVQSIPLLTPCVLEIDGRECRLLTGVGLVMPDEASRQGRAIGLDRLQLSLSDGTGVGNRAAHGRNDPRMPRWESGVVTAYLEYDGVGSDACEPMSVETLKSIK